MSQNSRQNSSQNTISKAQMELFKKQEAQIQSKVENTEQKPLSDADIKFYLPNTRILKYSDLSKYPSLEMLLPKPTDAIIILYESQPNSGHWVFFGKYPSGASKHIELTKEKTIYEYMDSYGNNVDTPLKWNTEAQNMGLNQSTPYLKNLLKGHNYVYNKIKFQKDMDRKNSVDQISCCGRYAVFRTLSLLDKHMDLKQFQDMMKQLKDHFHKTYDEVISYVISI